MRKACNRLFFVKETIGGAQYEYSFHCNIFDPVLSAIHSVLAFLCVYSLCVYLQFLIESRIRLITGRRLRAHSIGTLPTLCYGTPVSSSTNK